MKERVLGTMARGILLVLLASSTVACGFVTAPLSLATAEIASSGVKAADYSLEQGQQAAIYVRSKAAVAADESWQFLKETGVNIRESLQEQPGREVPVQRAALPESSENEPEISVSLASDED